MKELFARYASLPDGMELTLVVQREGVLLRAVLEGSEVALLAYYGGRLELALRYDFRPAPLKLSADARPGDAVRIVLRPYRIELYVNGVCVDEEWPCGALLLPGAEVETACAIAASPAASPVPDPRSVLGGFTHATGWMPGGGVFVGDCMPYCDGERYHVLYLKDRRHHRSKWGLGAHQWEHISTADMTEWQIHPMAVGIDDSAQGSICTGSWMQRGGRHYLFYTIRTCDGSPASICRSVSEDGYHFERDRSFAFCLSGRYCGASARDPKVVMGADGLFHMFLTTHRMSDGRGCLAHLTSVDLDTWTELDEEIYLHADSEEPECPDYFAVGGWHYLVYSIGGVGRYLYSREPFTGWRTPDDPAVPCKSVPKAAIWQGRILFAGFDRIDGYAGTLTFTEAAVRPDGQLSFREIIS